MGTCSMDDRVTQYLASNPIMRRQTGHVYKPFFNPHNWQKVELIQPYKALINFINAGRVASTASNLITSSRLCTHPRSQGALSTVTKTAA